MIMYQNVLWFTLIQGQAEYSALQKQSPYPW